MNEVEIKVFGSDPPCPRCKSALAAAGKVARKHKGVHVSHVDALSPEAEEYEVWMIPAVAVGGRLVCKGRIPTEEELEGYVSGLLAEDA